jgi:NAD(P)H-hydrate epimerase
MKIFNAETTRRIDQYTIDNEPISSLALMDRAAGKCADWICRNVSSKKNISILCGSGNNGGDGLVMAYLLSLCNYKVDVFLVHSSTKVSDDTAENLRRLKNQNIANIIKLDSAAALSSALPDTVWVDALFGSGLNRPIEGLAAEVIAAVNKAEGLKVAIDIPSGLYAEDNSKSSDVIFRADYTLTFQFPFLSFLLPESENYIGQWKVLDIGLHTQALASFETCYHITQKADVQSLLHTRKSFSHKGIFGHALIIAGSKGMAGAAVLAARACLRSGVGLCTVHSSGANLNILQTSVPESMCSADAHNEYITQLPDLSPYRAIAIGPGLRQQPATALVLQQLLQQAPCPLVIDADALNLLSVNPLLMEYLPANSILTPHPGEFDRLFGASGNAYSRLQKAMQKAQQYRVYIILKGAYTAIVTPQGVCYFNTTGNAGMATGGSGDVLTGIVVSLLAQAYEPLHACLLGVFLHGLSGDIAAKRLSQEAMLASDIVECLGKAFKRLSE